MNGNVTRNARVVPALSTSRMYWFFYIYLTRDKQGGINRLGQITVAARRSMQLDLCTYLPILKHTKRLSKRQFTNDIGRHEQPPLADIRRAACVHLLANALLESGSQ